LVGNGAIEAPHAATPRLEPSTGALPDLTEARPAAQGNAGFALAESRRVAEARAMLRRGDARGALALLARTAAEFPNGVLVQEREALTIEALNAAGDSGAARTRAAEFLRRYPESPHAAAARAVLGK
jgi:hypothetical protein